jgi:hypothetical protein
MAYFVKYYRILYDSLDDSLAEALVRLCREMGYDTLFGASSGRNTDVLLRPLLDVNQSGNLVSVTRRRSAALLERLMLGPARQRHYEEGERSLIAQLGVVAKQDIGQPVWLYAPL